MSASDLGRVQQRSVYQSGRRAAAGAIALGCLLGALTACSGGSDETASAPGTSAPTTAPTGAASTSAPTASPTSGAASAPASAVTTGAASTPAGPAPDAVVKISVQGRTVSPAPGRRTISVGDRVLLIVTTNTANVLHVHGVEIEEPTEPGVPLTVNFTAKEPGIYPVELHEPELLLVQLVVR